MKKILRCIPSAVLGLLPAISAAQDPALQALLATQKFNQVAISPDGRQVAWVRPEAPPGGSGVPRLMIYLAGALAGEPRQLTVGARPGEYEEKEICWSPDGTRLAFLSDCGQAGQLQLYVKSLAGGPARPLTHLNGALTRPQWSPDGRKLSVLFVENVHGILGAGSAGAVPDGEVSDDSFVERVMLVDAASGATQPLTPADHYAYECDWSPDSREIAYTAAPPPGDNTWYHARLYAVAVDNGHVREIYRPSLQIAVPRWSPDGRSVAFIEGLMSDKGSTGGDIWIVPATGGSARNLTPGRKGSPTWIKWQPQTHRLLFCELLDGGTAVSTMDPDSGKTAELWHDFGVIGSGEDHLSPRTTDVLALSIAKDETMSAVIRSSVSRPPEVWVGPLGAWAQRTQLNRDIRPIWGRVENLHWQSGPWTVEGWLVYPANYDPQRRYPLIVSVHGGPANQLSVAWPPPTGFDLALLSAQGYFVFCPNPRGSYGQGEAFTQANVKDYGFGPLADVMAGVDFVLKTRPVDPNRLGIAGGSYGGYMTMFAVTQTHRFRAAVAVAGMSNLQSEFGQTFVDQWMPFYFGANPYDDPEAYARASAMHYIGRATTPTLIFAGAGDKECPAAQSLEFWHALRALGVPTELLIYSGEGHGPRSRGHIIDRMDRTAGWFDEHLK